MPLAQFHRTNYALTTTEWLTLNSMHMFAQLITHDAAKIMTVKRLRKLCYHNVIFFFTLKKIQNMCVLSLNPVYNMQYHKL